MRSMREAFSRDSPLYKKILTVLFQLVYNQHNCYETFAADSVVYIRRPISRIEQSSLFSQGNDGTNFARTV